MTKENFHGLLESVREAGQIIRGEKEASRVFVIEVPDDIPEPINGFAVCIETDDIDLLIPHKIYEVTFFKQNKIGVIDEEGERGIYPAEFFIPVNLPPEIIQALQVSQNA